MFQIILRKKNSGKKILFFIFSGGRTQHPLPILRPCTLHALGLNLPRQLVVGYYWIAFFNQVRKNFKSETLNENFVELKIIGKLFLNIFPNIGDLLGQQNFWPLFKGVGVCRVLSRTVPGVEVTSPPPLHPIPNPCFR